MAKITLLEQKTYQGKPSGFKVTLDDGRSGNVQEKESDKGLRNGDEVTVTEIPYTSKAGVQSTLYGLRLVNTGVSTPPPQNTPNLPPKNVSQALSPSGGISALEIFKAKVEADLRVVEAIVPVLAEGKTSNTKAQEAREEWTAFMENTIDRLAGRGNI